MMEMIKEANRNKEIVLHKSMARYLVAINFEE